MRLRRALHFVFRPKVVLPVLLAAALFTVAFKLGDLGQVLARVQAIPVSVMALALAGAIVYLVFKFLQFRHLLVNLNLHPDWRRLVLAFCVGELSVTLPFGVFAQNWVLAVSSKEDFGRSAAATVVMLLTEILVVLLFLAVIGIPGWPELRPLAIVVVVGVLAVVFGVLRYGHVARRIGHKVKQHTLRRMLLEFIELLRGLRRLSRPHLLLLNVLIAAVYLGALAFSFTVVGHGVGVHHLSFMTAATIYAFSLAVLLLCGGILSQIGTMEVLGMTASQAWGLSLTQGLALMLGFRIVWTGAMWLVNLPLVFFLWRSIGHHHPKPDASSAPVADPTVHPMAVDGLKKATD